MVRCAVYQDGKREEEEDLGGVLYSRAKRRNNLANSNKCPIICNTLVNSVRSVIVIEASVPTRFFMDRPKGKHTLLVSKAHPNTEPSCPTITPGRELDTDAFTSVDGNLRPPLPGFR